MQLRFSGDVVVTLGELKVLNASDPIVLVGADAMTAPLPAKKPGAGWQFLHIGYGRRDCGGIMQFQSTRGLVRTVPLLSWPMPSSK